MSQKLLQRLKHNIKNMRNLFKLFTLFIIAVQLVSCEAEKVATHSGTSLLVSKKISLQQFLQETKINNFDASIHLENKLQNKTADGRYELTDFEIDTDLINRMEYNQKTTYSFVASPKDTITENYFNLIYFKKNNVWEMKIVELKPNPDNLIQLQSGLTTEFEGQMRMVYETVSTTMSQPCTYVTITVENCQGCVGTCDQCSSCVSSRTYSFCNSNIQYISSTPSAPSSFNGGDGGGGGANADTNEIVIDPNLANLDFNKIILFLNNLRTTDLAAFNYLNSHPEIKNQVMNYLNANDFSEESIIFVRQFVDQCVLNPTLNLDLKSSSKSPMNIDFSSIDNTTPERAKFNAVYDAIKTSPEFKSLFIDLFQNNNRINVEFKIGSVNNGANGNTSVIIGGFPICNTITISPAFLNSANKMEIAKTILHECIHAFLNIKLYDTGQGAAVSTLNNEQLFNVINQQYNGFSGSQDQHNFIYTYMLPTMVQILSDVKDTLVTPANNLEMNDVVVHIPYNNSPETRFVWADYFHNLSLNGLQNCSFFQNEIGIVEVINGLITPVNTINQTLMQSFIQYSIVSVNIHP